MIQATFSKNKDGYITSFKVEGHAGYAPSGRDIVCAAVSTITNSTINGMQALTEAVFEGKVDNGLTHINLISPTHGSNILIESMFLTLEAIQENYPNNLILNY